jgi:RND family efflux transporter MFP subunit
MNKTWWKNWYVIGGVIIVIVAGIWWGTSQKKTTSTAPITQTAQRGTLVQSVSGSGTLVPKIQASVPVPTYGRITSVFIKNGDVVKADQPMLAVHSLASAQDKAKGLATLLSAQDSYNQANTKFISLNQALTSAQQVLQDAQKNEAIQANTVTSAQTSYSKSLIDSKTAVNSAQKTVYDAGVTQDKASTDNEQASANLSATNAQLGVKSSALSSKVSVTDAKNSLLTAQRDEASITLKTQTADLSHQAAQANLSNQQVSLQTAQANLSVARLAYQMLTDQTVTAPVAGQIVNMNLVPGEIVDNGSSNTNTSAISTATSGSLFSIIDYESMRANISVSEVDIASVQVGQIATITLDALPDTTLTGTVATVDAVGTTTQGVTTYGVEITLDSIPKQVAPGMTANANIVTNTKENALIIPSTAVQSQGGQNTVQIEKNGTMQTAQVTTGISNDTDTEIISGLSAGDTVVTNPTTNTTAAARTTTGFSLFGGSGGTRNIRPGG